MNQIDKRAHNMKHDPTNPFLPTIDTKSFQRLVGTEPSASDLSLYALPPIQQGAITPGFPDFDHDGVPDLFDCDMHDPTRDGWAGDIYRSTREFVTPNYSRAADRRSAASATLISYASRPASKIAGYGAQTTDYVVQRPSGAPRDRTPQKSFVPDNVISAAGARAVDYVVQRPQQQSGAGTSRGISWDDAKRETFSNVRGTAKQAATSAVRFASNLISPHKASKPSPSGRRTAPPSGSSRATGILSSPKTPAKVHPTLRKAVTVRQPAKVPRPPPGSSKFTPKPVAHRPRPQKVVSRSRAAGMVYHPEHGYIRSV